MPSLVLSLRHRVVLDVVLDSCSLRGSGSELCADQCYSPGQVAQPITRRASFPSTPLEALEGRRSPPDSFISRPASSPPCVPAAALPYIRSYLLISSVALRLLLFHCVPRENPSLRTYQLNVVHQVRRGGIRRRCARGRCSGRA